MKPAISNSHNLLAIHTQQYCVAVQFTMHLKTAAVLGEVEHKHARLLTFTCMASLSVMYFSMNSNVHNITIKIQFFCSSSISILYTSYFNFMIRTCGNLGATHHPQSPFGFHIDCQQTHKYIQKTYKCTLHHHFVITSP